jgi:hypothetical protein
MERKTNRPATHRRDGAARASARARGAWQLELIAPSASPEEAAAIVAALERFMRATAPDSTAPQATPDQWRHAAILEGVRREDGRDAPDPWINT